MHNKQNILNIAQKKNHKLNYCYIKINYQNYINFLPEEIIFSAQNQQFLSLNFNQLMQDQILLNDFKKILTNNLIYMRDSTQLLPIIYKYFQCWPKRIFCLTRCEYMLYQKESNNTIMEDLNNSKINYLHYLQEKLEEGKIFNIFKKLMLLTQHMAYINIHNVNAAHLINH